jgi:hypothetical protein
MTVERARALLDREGYWYDYLQGRVMKIDIEGDELDPRLYDRDLGEGAAAAALAPLLKEG